MTGFQFSLHHPQISTGSKSRNPTPFYKDDAFRKQHAPGPVPAVKVPPVRDPDRLIQLGPFPGPRAGVF